jgi:hypothetical protein
MIASEPKETTMTIARLAVALVFVCGIAFAETAPSTVTCKDGSSSKGGRGACRGHGGIDKTKSPGGEAEAAPAPAEAPAAMVTCKDGSSSKGGRGACRGHGGVDKTGGAAASAPATPPAPAAAKTPPPAPPPHAAVPPPSTRTAKATGGKADSDDPTGALAKCKDGTYWHGTVHSGSCSHHGGVDSWLDGSEKK